ncbi:hypothetical protein ACF0H5_023009 [Mactra antiquata]
MINDTLNGIRNSFDEYTTMNVNSKRDKRSLLPIIGQLSSVLFGTVSETDLENINKNIEILSENQDNIVHDLKESITLLNLSRIQISENRRAIMDLIISVQKLDSKILEIKETLVKEITDLEQFLSTFLQFKLILEEIRQASQDALFYLTNLKNEVSMMSIHKLTPFTISPKDLRKLLVDIQDKLPDTAKLPADPMTDIWYFYDTLKCNAYLDKDKILIILSIPLIDVRENHELYNIINLPLPLRNVSLINGKHLNMVAQYKLDSEAIIIDKTRTKYSLISKEDFKRCNDRTLRYCDIKRVINPVNLSKSCVISLFLSHSQNIETFCDNNVVLDTKLPYAKYLHSKTWVIGTNIPLTLTIVCKNNVTSTTVDPPIDIITLGLGCKASNDFIQLISHDETRLTFDGRNSYDSFVSTYKISNVRLWRNFTDKFPNVTKLKLPTSLNQLKEIPMSSFILHVKNNKKTDVNNLSSWSFWNYLTCIVCCLLILIITSLCCYKKKLIRFWLRRLANSCNDRITDDNVTQRKDDSQNVNSITSTDEVQKPRETDIDKHNESIFKN